jgi:Transposase zinc-binding domain/Putative transposase
LQTGRLQVTPPE